MSDEAILLLLRLLSALLLLGFIGVIGFFIYRDIELTTAGTTRRDTFGFIIILESNIESLKAGEKFPLLPITSIGRSPLNHVVIEDEYTSGRHALLVFRSNQWWLEDLQSRNGTMLNGLPVEEPTVITPSDEITIGRASFKLDIDQPEI
jgi:hypothetical protein